MLLVFANARKYNDNDSQVRRLVVNVERVFRTECSTPSVPLFEATGANCGTDVSIQGMRLRVPSQPGTYRLRTRVLFQAL